MLFLATILFLLPFGENTNKYQNPFRRPVASSIFLNIISYSIWLSIGSLVSIAEALPLIG
jgi:quinol-cytochrome oxidoreductase complex cytochrome b subunit